MANADRVGLVFRHLEQMIHLGELVPGDQLPSERELSLELDVSRSVVREAIGRLASLGMVASVHGSGTRVATPTARPTTSSGPRWPWCMRPITAKTPPC